MFARWVFGFGGSSLLGLSLLGKNFPTICGLSQIRWCAESLFGIFPTSIFGLDKIRWCEKACLALALHPFSVSTNSDGVPDKKRSNSYHRFSAWAESDGSPSKSAQITYIHLRFQSNPMESKPYTAKSGSIQVWLQANSDGEHATAPLYQRLLTMFTSELY